MAGLRQAFHSTVRQSTKCQLLMCILYLLPFLAKGSRVFRTEFFSLIIKHGKFYVSFGTNKVYEFKKKKTQIYRHLDVSA